MFLSFSEKYRFFTCPGEKDQYEGAKVYIRSLRKKGLTQAFRELVQDPEEGSSDSSSSSGESPVLGARAQGRSFL